MGRRPAANEQDKEKFGTAKSTSDGRRTARREDSKNSWIGADGDTFGWLIAERARGFAEILSNRHSATRQLFWHFNCLADTLELHLPNPEGDACFMRTFSLP